MWSSRRCCARIDALPAREEEICFVADLALARHGSGPEQDEFCLRFQQTTGPAVAKSDEDTAFYRWLPLVALAEVGGSPSHSAVDPHEFAEWAARRGDAYPSTMNSLSTHDTKRTEDVRARVALLSEIAGEYVATISSWRERAGLAGEDEKQSVEPVLEWIFWQTLVGAWPITADRLGGYLLKAAREAKQSTSWAAPDEAYEQRIAALVDHVLADDDLMAGIVAFVDRLHPGFVANVLAQRLLQLVIPGVPDVYQGCEVVALTLVDPDNRQPVDLDVRAADLERGLSAVPDPAADLDAAKARLVALGLGLRRDRPDLLGPGAPLTAVPVVGDAAHHAVGLRRGDDVAALATRWPLRLASAGGWRGATVQLPVGRWVDVLTGQQVTTWPTVRWRSRRCCRPGRLRCWFAAADVATLEVWAPRASSVEVDLEARRCPLTPSPDRDGWWVGSVPGLTHGIRYALVLDGSEPLPDPLTRRMPAGTHAPSQWWDPSRYAWADDAWSGLDFNDPRTLLYELHVGTFTDHGYAGRCHRPPRPPRRAGRDPRRADAAGGLRRRTWLGLRRGRAERGARAVRRP